MEIGDWPATESLNSIYREIRDLGLETNLAEMEAFGFTVIPNALSPELTVKVRGAILRAAEDFHNVKLDLETEESFRGQQGIPYLLYKDPVFEDVVLDPKSVALMSYFLGRGFVLTGLYSHLKGPGGDGLALHTDTSYATPSPYSPYQHIANCNYILTDYTEEKGALAIVPGSHRLGRPPTPWESSLAGNTKNPNAIPIEAPPGSSVLFLGTTWHGSYPRQVPGLRVNLSAAYVRPYMKTLETYHDRVPAGFLERHGGRDSLMAQLVGLDVWPGWHEEGPDREKQLKARELAKTWQG